MRHSLALLAAGALFLSPVLAESLLGQQPAAPAPATQQPAAQGQPAGRQGGDAAGRQGGGQGRQGGGGGRGGGRAAGPPPGPAPRNAAGRVHFGTATPLKEKILWTGSLGIRDIPAPAESIPFQPWAKALWEDREKHELEPHARCKASAMLRQFLTPYGTEIVELPEMQRIYIFDVGGPHTFRTI